jgi:O-antigen/teichoic acid export membrane protein
MKVTPKNEIYLNYLWRVIHFFIKSVVPLAINFYGAKVLVPEKFGEVVYFLTLISIITLLSNFGISSSTLKLAAESNLTKDGKLVDIFPSATRISLIAVFPITVIFCLFYPDHLQHVLYSLPFIVLSPIISILDGIYVGTTHFRKLAIGTLIPSVIALVSNVLVINYFSEQGILLSYSLFYSLLFIFYYINFPYKGGSFSMPLAKKIFSYALTVGIGSIAFFLYSKVDILILKEFNYLREIAFYEIIMRIFELLIIPIVLAAQVASPYFIKLNSGGNFSQVSKYILLSSGGIFLLGAIVGLSGYFIFPFVIETYYPLYFSDEFLNILKILLSTIPLKFLGVFMTTAIATPLGYARIISSTTLIFGAINVALDIILINQMGFIGIFWATFIVHNSNIFLQYFLFWRAFNKRNLNYVEA